MSDTKPFTKGDWKTIPRVVCRQIDNGDPIPTDVTMSVKQFKWLFPFYTISTTTICSPQIHNWIAELPDGSALWIGIKDDEINF